MISFLSKLFFELVESIRLRADRCSTALLNHTEDSGLLVHLVLTNVDMLFDAVNRSAFEVCRRIQHPTRVDDEIDGYRFEY